MHSKVKQVSFKRLHLNAVVPEYANPGDAGADLRAVESVMLNIGDIKVVRTGLAVELPEGVELQVRPRSGLAAKYGITVLNSPGTIDSGYRGEIGVILINHGPHAYVVSAGDKIAQAVFAPFFHVKFNEVEELGETQRGSGGFGSSGK